MLKKTILDPSPGQQKSSTRSEFPLESSLLSIFQPLDIALVSLPPAMQMHTDGQTEDLSWEQFAV